LIAAPDSSLFSFFHSFLPPPSSAISHHFSLSQSTTQRHLPTLLFRTLLSTLTILSLRLVLFSAVFALSLLFSNCASARSVGDTLQARTTSTRNRQRQTRIHTLAEVLNSTLFTTLYQNDHRRSPEARRTLSSTLLLVNQSHSIRSSQRLRLQF
jgi:hypothetical protein